MMLIHVYVFRFSLCICKYTHVCNVCTIGMYVCNRCMYLYIYVSTHVCMYVKDRAKHIKRT